MSRPYARHTNALNVHIQTGRRSALVYRLTATPCMCHAAADPVWVFQRNIRTNSKKSVILWMELTTNNTP